MIIERPPKSVGNKILTQRRHFHTGRLMQTDTFLCRPDVFNIFWVICKVMRRCLSRKTYSFILNAELFLQSLNTRDWRRRCGRRCFWGTELRRLQAETSVRSLLHGIELIKFFKKRKHSIQSGLITRALKDNGEWKWNHPIDGPF